MNWIDIFYNYHGQKLNNWDGVNLENPITFRQHSDYYIKDSVFLLEKSAINYVEKSIENGTIAIITQEKISTHLPVYAVDNLDDFKKKMVAYNLQFAKFKIAVTGSVGKTTFTRNLGFYLNNFHEIHTNFRNFNSCVGLPINIMSGPKNAIHCYEMGISHPNDMDKLLDIFTPDLAICLPIKYSHSENFVSLDQLEDEKLKIFRGVKIAIAPQIYKEKIQVINGEAKFYPLENFYLPGQQFIPENYNKILESIGNLVLDNC
jgi:alanine racemase